MKLLRFGEIGREKPGLLDKDGHVRDLSAHVKDITGDILSPDGLKRLAAINASDLPRVPSGVRMGAPVAGINKLVAIGLNYADHAAEAGMQLPTEPIFFMKATDLDLRASTTMSRSRAARPSSIGKSSWASSSAPGPSMSAKPTP